MGISIIITIKYKSVVSRWFTNCFRVRTVIQVNHNVVYEDIIYYKKKFLNHFIFIFQRTNRFEQATPVL